MSVTKRGTGSGGREGVLDVAPKRGGPSRSVPVRQPRITRDRTAEAIGGVLPQAFRPIPSKAGRCWTPRDEKRGRRLKGAPAGGSAEQASNTARGTPGKRRTCGYDTEGRFATGRLDTAR